ncbi:MAG: cysteine--tRNA ligase [Patescibacteria group bacterium]|nr:cysteine--tRNA ligase [Patescibacteria group bacterium]
MLIFNSFSNKKETFKPISDQAVKIYVCGITPYDTTHLGHAFTYVFFDTVIRYLKFKGYRVIQAQNITDIDDDILKKAKEVNQNWRDLGNYWTDRFLSDLKTLNVDLPDHYIKATESIETMNHMISKLLSTGFAYKTEGNVYFDVRKYKKYGSLSRLDKKQMVLVAKERGGNPDDKLKKNPLDFILWQKQKKGEPFWESPFGRGRPGWHIECSAMINKYLGDQIDIHGGGKDLIFPHHESEIAQSESYTGKTPFVKYWMHTSMLLYKGEKMSKSLGNLIMVDDLLKKYSANEIRYVLLAHHYRKPWEYDESMFLEAKRSIAKIKKALTMFKTKGATYPKKLPEEFTRQMEDDFNIPNTLAFLIKLSEKIIDSKNVNNATAYSLGQIASILGFSF